MKNVYLIIKEYQNGLYVVCSIYSNMTKARARLKHFQSVEPYDKGVYSIKKQNVV